MERGREGECSPCAGPGLGLVPLREDLPASLHGFHHRAVEFNPGLPHIRAEGSTQALLQHVQQGLANCLQSEQGSVNSVLGDNRQTPSLTPALLWVRYSSAPSHHPLQMGNHRITESLRLEKTTEITQSSHQPNTTISLSVTSTCFLNTSRGADSTNSHLEWAARSNAFRGEIFPNIQPQPPLAQLEAILSHPITITWEMRLTSALPQSPFREL